MKKKKVPFKKFIGRTDRVDLPELDLEDIDAKVDTGAYTSAIYCRSYELGEDEQGKYLEFYLLDKKHPAYNNRQYRVRKFTRRVIKNSFGQKEERYIITTPLLIFGRTFETEFSLSNRKKMKYPILLGRKFLRAGFLVDVNKYNLSYKEKGVNNS